MILPGGAPPTSVSLGCGPGGPDSSSFHLTTRPGEDTTPGVGEMKSVERVPRPPWSRVGFLNLPYAQRTQALLRIGSSAFPDV
jgi:hypothetical protein